MTNAVPKFAPIREQPLALVTGSGDEAIEAKVKEVRDLRERAERKHRDANEADFAIERAEQEHRQALADFERGKLKKKPTTAAVDKAKLEAERLHDEAGILEHASKDAEAELGALYAERGPEVAARLRKEAEAEKAALHADFVAAAKRIGKIESLKSRALFFESPGTRMPVARGLTSTAIQKLNGEHVQPAEALSVLIEATDPDRVTPTPDQRTWPGQTREPQPLKPVPRAA